MQSKQQQCPGGRGRRGTDLPGGGVPVGVGLRAGDGDPIVTPGRETCDGVKNGSCFFTISQNICVAVPVAFGAVATVGDSYISCNGASSQDICAGCDSIQPLPPVTQPEPDEEA